MTKVLHLRRRRRGREVTDPYQPRPHQPQGLEVIVMMMMMTEGWGRQKRAGGEKKKGFVACV